MTFGSLFAGVGGFDLGLERAGMECRWQVEIDPFCRKVLEKHWPDVPRYEDVREVGRGELEDVDLICGGFPCQDISVAGQGGGIEGERSGLWVEFARIIRELQPRYALVENSPALTSRGLGRLLGDLAEIGYDADWTCVPAAAFGAPHLRWRIFVVAHSDDRGQPPVFPAGQPLADSRHQDRERAAAPGGRENVQPLARQSGHVPNANSERREEPDAPAEPSGKRLDSGRSAERWGAWRAEPDVGRVAYGVPDGVDRIRALGNAVVPQVAEWLGKQILAHHQGREA